MQLYVGIHKAKTISVYTRRRQKYTLKVNGAEGVYTKNEFERTLKDILGHDAEIDIQFVDTIPVLASVSLRRQYVIINQRSNTLIKSAIE